MKQRKAYCSYCKEEVMCNVRMAKSMKKISGVSIVYKHYSANCRNCGNRVFIQELIDMNVKAYDVAFNKAMRGKQNAT